MSMIRAFTRGQERVAEPRAMELQFFLNDLPGNDFNVVFQVLEQFNNLAKEEKEEEEEMETTPYYVAGLPGSFYTRLLPYQSVHLFHSSYCLMWRAKLDMLVHGEVGSIWELLSEALRCLVQKGLVEKKKLVSFNLPFYAPSVDEVKALIKEKPLFDIENIRLFQTNWDPHDDSDGDMVQNCASSREIIAKGLRAVIEPLIRDHFGESVIHELFVTFTSIVARHLEKGKAKFTVIVISLHKAMH
ncbi:hypothetical protein ACP70R_041455 [Stipagrostis hirtigluma subsp. patula]